MGNEQRLKVMLEVTLERGVASVLGQIANRFLHIYTLLSTPTIINVSLPLLGWGFRVPLLKIYSLLFIFQYDCNNS